ncbi:MAG: hypothetical protein C7B45_10205 [Sulfobacillus acidophilus]|uniref:DUF3800 domain-containing protein n=1 Tax=Sulfobacillus acidophilus TaxID=53633 RepID=A0A2T2WH58_9FIRM|nr:MAG: hypothetical protein C7B45_10205 [Sulfobacillus acidophilus]
MVVSIDESQDTERFVLRAIATPDMVTAQGIVGDLRKAARQLHVALHEFHEADLYRDHPRLLTRSLELMSTAKRKKHPYPRREVCFLGTYYIKASTEQHKPTLTQRRMLTVYFELLQALIWALPLTPQEKLTVICDWFQGCLTLQSAVDSLLAELNGTLAFGNSATQKPLQLADLLVGTLRRHLAGDRNEDRFCFVKPLLHHLGAVSVKQ